MNDNYENKESKDESCCTRNISGFMCRKCGFYNKLVDQVKNKKPTPNIPNDLESFLIKLTVNIIEQNPNDLDQFAFEYFDNIRLKNSRCKLYCFIFIY